MDEYQNQIIWLRAIHPTNTCSAGIFEAGRYYPVLVGEKVRWVGDFIDRIVNG